jgi:hypothetical protein
MPGPASARLNSGGHPWQQKTQVLRVAAMGSRLRGNGAAVLLLTPHVQQSRAVAQTFAPFTVSRAKPFVCWGVSKLSARTETTPLPAE